MLTVKFLDRADETFQTVSYNTAGGFIVIVEQLRGMTRTTCIPSGLIDRVIIEQNT